MQTRQLSRDMRMTMKSLVKGQVMTYTVCGGDDDRTGDERQAIVHADLECSFPAKTARNQRYSAWGTRDRELDTLAPYGLRSKLLFGL